MPFKLPDLPYAHDALEPHIDERTMQIHHGKHHQGYTNNLNAATEGTRMDGLSIESLPQSPASGAIPLGSPLPNEPFGVRYPERVGRPGHPERPLGAT